MQIYNYFEFIIQNSKVYLRIFSISISIILELGNILFSKIELRGIAGKFSEPITEMELSKYSKQFL